MFEFVKGTSLVSVAFCSVACAGNPAPLRVRYADIGAGALRAFTGREPLVVEFQRGDRLPVNLSFKGDDFELQPTSPPLELVAKRHCFVRFDGDGIHTSLDGQHFDGKPRVPGSFHIGFNAQRGRATRLDVAIVAPQR